MKRTSALNFGKTSSVDFPTHRRSPKDGHNACAYTSDFLKSPLGWNQVSDILNLTEDLITSKFIHEAEEQQYPGENDDSFLVKENILFNPTPISIEGMRIDDKVRITDTRPLWATLHGEDIASILSPLLTNEISHVRSSCCDDDIRTDPMFSDHAYEAHDLYDHDTAQTFLDTIELHRTKSAASSKRKLLHGNRCYKRSSSSEWKSKKCKIRRDRMPQTSQSCNVRLSGKSPSPVSEFNEASKESYDALGDSVTASFRNYQADMWQDKLEQLKMFRENHGHCLVPHNWSKNVALAQWVKRQRYQFKLKQEGRHSTLTAERQKILDELGFIWDSHRAIWEERLNEIREFKERYGHCNVPSHFPENNTLSVWVKSQRRQYKLFFRGQPSTMTRERIQKLSDVGFVWDPRKLLCAPN